MKLHGRELHHLSLQFSYGIFLPLLEPLLYHVIFFSIQDIFVLLSSPFVGCSRHTAILDIFAAGGRFAAASLDECNCGNCNRGRRGPLFVGKM